MPQIRKIVDTIQNYGIAERFILLDADFVRFLRKKYSKQEIIWNINQFDVVKKYNLKGIVFGNYVTQEERFFFLFKIEKQLEALSKIKGNFNIGYGLLIIAFGAEGKSKANAHFNPGKMLINLARGRKADYNEMLKGENSFIHEYGHFIDFIQGRTEPNFFHNFASEAKPLEKVRSRISVFSNPTNDVLSDVDYTNYLKELPHSGYWTSNVEIWARLFEFAITIIVHGWPDKNFKRFFEISKYGSPVYYPAHKIKQFGLDKKVIKAFQSTTLPNNYKKFF